MESTVVIFNADGALAHQPFAIARSADIDEGPVAARLLGRPLVLWRSPSGAVVVAPDSCPHSKAVLSEGRVKDGCLVCPNHGWTFGDAGRCVAKPSNLRIGENSHLTTYQCTERYGLVWVSLGDPAVEVAEVGCDSEQRWRRIQTASSVWRGNPIQITETLLAELSRTQSDVVAHVPFSIEAPLKSKNDHQHHCLLSCAPIDGRTSFVASVVWTTARPQGEDAEILGALADDLNQAKQRIESEWIPLPTIEIPADQKGTTLGDWKQRFAATLSSPASG